MNESAPSAMTSYRPYLLRALWEWIADNGMTPHLMVDAGRPGVQGRDGRLDLVGSRLAMPHGLVDQGQPFGDHLGAPQRPILGVQQHHLAFRVEAGRGAGVL